MRSIRIFITMCIGCVPVLLVAQSDFEYKYDKAGNRIERNTLVLRKASSGSGVEGIENAPLVFGVSNSNNELPQSGLEVSLFPNPTSDIVNISYSEEDIKTDEVRVMDGQGKIMYKQTNLFGEFQVPFGKFPPGAYYVWIRVEGSIERVKVVKE